MPFNPIHLFEWGMHFISTEYQQGQFVYMTWTTTMTCCPMECDVELMNNSAQCFILRVQVR